MPSASKPHYTESLIDENGVLSPSWGRAFEELYRRIGAEKDYNIGGTLNVNTTTAGNTLTGEDDLISYALGKNTLQNAGEFIKVTAFGTFANNANNKTLKLYLGSQELFSTGAVAFQNQDWCLESKIIRTGQATQKCITNLFTDYADITNIVNYVSGSQDFTTSLTIKCTGEGTATNDIVQESLITELFPV